MPSPLYGLTYLARMGSLLRDRILLLQFLCTTEVPVSETVPVRDVEDIGTPLLPNASG